VAGAQAAEERAMTAPGIALDDVRFDYDDMHMLFDAVIPPRAFLGVIGPSGAGKSSLLNLIAGFEAPLSGRILIGDSDCTAAPPQDRPVTMLFQENNLFFHLDVLTNVALGISPALKLTEKDHAALSAALGRVGLTGLERRLPRELSGGERQRVAIARALVRQRPVLLLDEPFAALGPALRHDMLQLVRDLRDERGLTVVFVTHNPGDAERAATHTAFVEGGRIIALRQTAEFFAERDLPGLAAYLGD
jgi:thiamine transport system ATP-binding protein